MIKVYLSIDNNAEVILLPVSPESYQIGEPWENTEVNGLQQTLNIIKNKGLSTIEISSFFPIRDYPFLLNRNMWGKEYVDKIKSWREKRYPIRIVIIDTDKSVPIDTVNMAVAIDNFTHETRKDGDIYYTLSMKEFPFVRVKA